VKPARNTVDAVLGRAVGVRVLATGPSGYLLETSRWIEPWHVARLETNDGRYWDDVTIAWCRTTGASVREFRAHAQCDGSRRGPESLSGFLRRRGKVPPTR
jgi:hypothetical protein